ncbi:MAG: hypothetical protein PCFJNLEI_01928 [Verrucomicrobiae bacterium]|nr:hypothetical protein [Verrucomicrobiae bacterium]
MRRFIAVALMVLCSQLAVQATVTNGLVGWWKLDEASGTTAADSSGNGNSGVLSNSPTWSSGILVGGLLMTTNKWMEIPHSAAFNLTNALSLSIWVKPTLPGAAAPSYTGLFEMNGYYSGFCLYYTFTRSVLFQMTGQNGNSLASISYLPTNRWSHIVATFNGSQARLYVNGLLDRAARWTGVCLTNNQPIRLNGFGALSGTVDDARLYNRAITEAEVNQLFFAGDSDHDRLPNGDDPCPDTPDCDGDGYPDGQEVLAGTDPLNASSHPDFVTGLAGHWNLNENSGTMTTDATGGNQGRLINSPVSVVGILSNAYGFNGVNQYVAMDSNISSTNALAVTNLTVSVWSYVTNVNQIAALVERRDSTKGYAVWWQKSYNRVIPWLPGIPAFSISLTDWRTNEWHLLTFTYDGAQVRGYVNGQLWRTDVFTNAPGQAAQPFFLGQFNSYGGRYQGRLDDVRVYSNALSAGTIAALALVDTDGDGIPDPQELRLGTNPALADTDGDGMPDTWEVAYGLDALSANGVNGAAGDYDNDGITNLDEYLAGTDPNNPDTTPPVITYTPQPNAAGWYTNAVTITFSASDDHTNYVWLTAHQFTITGETNDCEIVVSAKDSAGNVATWSAWVNLDLTPPAITLFPGQGGTNDWSNPILAIEYYDTNTTTVGAMPSGLDFSSLLITLNGVDMTTNFHQFADGAALSTNLAYNLTNTWSATIADYAGNAVTSTVSFSSTGAVNGNAPVMSAFNVGDGTAAIELPSDLDRIWLQADVSDTNAQHGVSVNGKDGGSWDVRGNTAGGFVWLEPGTNIVIMTGDKGGGNQSSYLMVLVRGEKYQAGVLAPGIDVFANGNSQTYSGYVSRVYSTEGTNAVAVTNAWLNGVAVTWVGYDSVSNLLWTATIPTPTNCDTFTSINLRIACDLGITHEAPLALLECYEIIKKQTLEQSGIFEWAWTSGDPCPGEWRLQHLTTAYLSTSTFLAPPGTNTTRALVSLDGCIYNPPAMANCCFTEPDPSGVPWGWTGTNSCVEVGAAWPVDGLGLTFGSISWEIDYEYTTNSLFMNNAGCWGGLTDLGRVMASPRWPVGAANEITFVAPQIYKRPDGSPTTVVFTFEGMQYATVPGVTMNLTNVNFHFNGVSYSPVSTNGGNVSYVIPLQGGSTNTIYESNFTWPTHTLNGVAVLGEGYNFCYEWEALISSNIVAHQLSFTGFHNHGGIEVVVKKHGTNKAPEDGLVVKTGDTLDIALSPDVSAEISSVIWQYRQLKSDGSYTAWATFSETAPAFEYVTTQGGIFQVQAVLGQGPHQHEIKLLRRLTEKKPFPIGKYGNGKKGEPDAVGVADTQIQIDIRNQTKQFLGANEYLYTQVVPAMYGFSQIPSNILKCNIFVAHQATAAGAVVPAINGYLNHYPPTANQWAGTENLDWFGQAVHWALFPTINFPQPGFVIAHPKLGFGHGHCGVVDYDGPGIGAGTSYGVSKLYNFYQYSTTRMRKYVP